MTSTGTKIYEKELDVFNKYLSVWVAICILFGTLVGYFFPSLSVFLSELEYSNVSLPIAAVLLIMMYPIMLNVKYSELLHIRKNAKVMAFTLIINWGIQPFVMAIIAWFFMTVVFSSIIPEKLQNEYMMGMVAFVDGMLPCKRVEVFLASNPGEEYCLDMDNANVMMLLPVTYLLRKQMHSLCALVEYRH